VDQRGIYSPSAAGAPPKGHDVIAVPESSMSSIPKFATAQHP